MLEQEHLDRHITAKHRAAKDHICDTCGKGFARKDILKRHQQGHEKQAALAAEAARAEASGTESTASSVKGKKRAINPEVTLDDGNGPVKAPRVGRACARCRSSKLRCDGELPCARCQKAGVDCSFDRPTKASTGRAHSVAMSDDMSPGMSSGSGGDSEDRADYDDDYLPILPTPPTNFDAWRPPANASGFPPLPPSYGLGARPPGAHHALPPNSFLAGAPSPGYYPPTSNPYNYRPPAAAYPNPAMFASLNLPHHVGSPLNPFAQPPPSQAGHPVAGGSQAPAPNAHYDDSSFGRQIGDSSNDFLDLISSGANDDAIDWSVLGAGFAGQGSSSSMLSGSAGTGPPTGPHGHPTAMAYTPRGASPGTANDHGAGLLAAAAAAAASQPLSDMRHNGTTEADPLAPVSASESYAMSADEDGESQPDAANAPRNRRHRNSLVESDNAAVSLLQLASANHTPRVSPEPESAPSSSSVNHGHKPASSSRLHQSYVNPADPDLEIETPETASGEETPRLSHLAPHTPSDPWPLSYRPTEPTEDPLPSSARGTGYGSRATSPPPHASQHAPLNHVPHVTESTRYRILCKVRDLADSAGRDSSISDRFVPRLELLELFVQLYFDQYHATFPLLHQPTWDPNSAPSFLVLAVASVGARYAYERVVGASMHAHALLECSRRMMQVMGDLDNTLLRTVAWQQTLLIVLLTGMISGNKRDLERTQALASMPTTYARRQGWLNVAASQRDQEEDAGLSVDDKWRRWRDREEIRRLGFGAIMVDCMGTALWNTENAALFADAADTPLPCSAALWDASTALLWQAETTQTASTASPTTSAAIQHVCSSPADPTSASPVSRSLEKNVFALSIVLAIIHALSWTKEHASWTEKSLFSHRMGVESNKGASGRDGSKADEDDSSEALRRGIEYFQDRVLLPASMLARTDQPTLTAENGSMALMLHLTALSHRLPLRVLQPLARISSLVPNTSTQATLKAWSTASNGSVARETLYHAGQIIGLCCTSLASASNSQPPAPPAATGTESPVEPFALFYASLAVVAWIEENAVDDEDAEQMDSNGAGPEARGGGDELALDILRDRTDPSLVSFFQSTSSSGSDTPRPIVPTLSNLGRLDRRATAHKVLRLAGQHLTQLKCWKVGESLGRTLIEVVRKEEHEQGKPTSGDDAGPSVDGAGSGGARAATDPVPTTIALLPALPGQSAKEEGDSNGGLGLAGRGAGVVAANDAENTTVDGADAPEATSSASATTHLAVQPQQQQQPMQQDEDRQVKMEIAV
ncbi:hypothetical protein JCM10212_003491 [Sporobolomyces blumeae]